jgi:hypothetical protein
VPEPWHSQDWNLSKWPIQSLCFTQEKLRPQYKGLSVLFSANAVSAVKIVQKKKQIHSVDRISLWTKRHSFWVLYHQPV